jgi:hypothetical protein
MTNFKKQLGNYKRNAITELVAIASNFRQANVAIFHEFVPPPTSGWHQFMRGLWRQFEFRNIKVENNVLSLTTRACLLILSI